MLNIVVVTHNLKLSHVNVLYKCIVLTLVQNVNFNSPFIIIYQTCFLKPMYVTSHYFNRLVGVEMIRNEEIFSGKLNVCHKAWEFLSIFFYSFLCLPKVGAREKLRSHQRRQWHKHKREIMLVKVTRTRLLPMPWRHTAQHCPAAHRLTVCHWSPQPERAVMSLTWAV